MLYRTNATLTTKSTTGNTPTGFDPVTGEPIFGTQTVTLSASLEEASEPQEIAYPGIDASATYLEGRCIDPKSLPSAFKPHILCDIEYRSQGDFIRGKFYILPTVNSRLGLESYFGGAIAGFLILS